MNNQHNKRTSLTRAALLIAMLAGCDSASTTNSGGSDVTSSDSAQDVSTLCPPSNRPEATQEATAGGESMCLTVFEKKAFDLLATGKPVGTSEACDWTPPDPRCFVKLVLSRPISGGVFGVSYELYKAGSPPQRFEFDTCNETSGRCEFDGNIGVRPVKVVFDIGLKTFVINDSSTLFPYKLVEE